MQKNFYPENVMHYPPGKNVDFKQLRFILHGCVGMKIHKSHNEALVPFPIWIVQKENLMKFKLKK